MPLRDRTGPEGLGPFTGRRGMSFGINTMNDSEKKSLRTITLIGTGIGLITGLIIGTLINKKN